MTAIYCSQNLFGIVQFDEYGVKNTLRLDILSNGLEMKNNEFYLADWSSVMKVDKSGKIIEMIKGEGWDNIHTVRKFRDQLLIASTGNDKVFLGNEIIFEPKNYGFRGFTYVNSAIPYTKSEILIEMRNLRTMIIFDIDRRKIERTVTLPFLNNMHNATPYYDDLFLVSDGDGIVLFDLEGRPVVKSEKMNWNRGIFVRDRYHVYTVDRNSVYEWNPVNNRVIRRWHGPYTVYQDVKVKDEVVTAGAFFDVVVED